VNRHLHYALVIKRDARRKIKQITRKMALGSQAMCWTSTVYRLLPDAPLSVLACNVGNALEPWQNH